MFRRSSKLGWEASSSAQTNSSCLVAREPVDTAYKRCTETKGVKTWEIAINAEKEGAAGERMPADRCARGQNKQDKDKAAAVDAPWDQVQPLVTGLVFALNAGTRNPTSAASPACK